MRPVRMAVPVVGMAVPMRVGVRMPAVVDVGHVSPGVLMADPCRDRGVGNQHQHEQKSNGCENLAVIQGSTLGNARFPKTSIKFKHQ